MHPIIGSDASSLMLLIVFLKEQGESMFNLPWASKIFQKQSSF